MESGGSEEDLGTGPGHAHPPLGKRVKEARGLRLPNARSICDRSSAQNWLGMT